MQASQRSASWENIFDDGITKVSIPADFSDHGYVIRNAARLSQNVFHERASMKGEQSLIATHTRTAPPGQYERRPMHPEMITLEDRRT